jgi:hypothetical protein
MNTKIARFKYFIVIFFLIIIIAVCVNLIFLYIVCNINPLEPSGYYMYHQP